MGREGLVPEELVLAGRCTTTGPADPADISGNNAADPAMTGDGISKLQMKKILQPFIPGKAGEPKMLLSSHIAQS